MASPYIKHNPERFAPQSEPKHKHRWRIHTHGTWACACGQYCMRALDWDWPLARQPKKWFIFPLYPAQPNIFR